MITFEEFKQSGFYNENDYNMLKEEYISVFSPKIRAIDKLVSDNANLFDCGCCWVTDYGSLDGNETDDDTLIRIFTYDGTLNSVGYEIDMDFGFKKCVKDLENTPLHEQLMKIFNADFYDYADYPQRTLGWYRIECKELDEYYNMLVKAVKLIKETMEENKPKEYMWVASSNDDSFEDKSDRYFTSKEECYNDMRNAVLEKMKWNTNYREDFEGHRVDGVLVPYEDDDNEIGYNVHFHPNHIVHESFSGVYTYQIVEKRVKSLPRFTIDAEIECDDENAITQVELALQRALETELINFKSKMNDGTQNSIYGNCKVKSLKISNIEHGCI